MRVLARGSLDRTSSGKVRRHVIAQNYPKYRELLRYQDVIAGSSSDDE